MNKWVKVVSIIVLLSIIVYFGLRLFGEESFEYDEIDILQSGNIDGINGLVGISSNGNWYVLNGNKWKFIQEGFDPDFADIYSVQNETFFVHDDGELIPLFRNFEDGFESALSIQDVIVSQVSELYKGWTSLTLHSPNAKSISAYQKVANDVLSGRDFLDNRIDISEEKAKSGEHSMKFYAVEPSEDMVTSKSSLSSEGLFYFEKGDNFWFSADYYVEQGMPFTIFDIETTHIVGFPGIRIRVDGGKYLGVQLAKWFHGEEFLHQQKEVEFPREEWVNIKMHLYLSEKAEEGKIELWQNSVKIFNVSAQTLPLAGTIYNSPEIGISATDIEATLFVDNVRISSKKF